MEKIPILEYLRSRTLLTRDERDIVRREISDLEDVVELRKKEILTRSSHRQLEQIEKTLSYHLALLAPIRLLPPEVLGEIFVHFKSLFDGTRLSSLYQVMRLSRVCNTWRMVLLHTPKCWTAISIPKRPDAQFASLLQLQLVRSGSLPLRLSIPEFRMPPQDIFDVLCLSTHRFETLHITLPLHSRFFSGPNTLDSLKEIRILYNEEPSPLMTIAAQKLRSVVLLNSLRYWVHCRVDLPWAQLTCLEIRGTWFIEDIFGILDECSNLLELTTHLQGGFAQSSGIAEDFVPSHPVVLPLLHTWKNTQPAGQTFTDLALGTLVLTNLRTLRFESPPSLPQLLSLVERSSCALACLQINDSSQMSETAQMQLVESLPSLRTFIHIIKNNYNVLKHRGVSPLVKRLLAARRLQHNRLC